MVAAEEETKKEEPLIEEPSVIEQTKTKVEKIAQTLVERTQKSKWSFLLILSLMILAVIGIAWPTRSVMPDAR